MWRRNAENRKGKEQRARYSRRGGKAFKTLTFSVGAAIALSGCGAYPAQDSTAAQESAAEAEPLRVLVQQADPEESELWQRYGAQRLYDETGLRLETLPGGRGGEAELKQYMAAGTLPDVIGLSDAAQAQLLMDAGLLLSLDQYRTLLPAIFEETAYREATDYWRRYYGDGAALYLMPAGIGQAGELAFEALPQLRWESYEKAGCPAIETLEDYLEVVRRMGELQPTTAAGERVYGFSLWRDSDVRTPHAAAGLSALCGIETGTLSPVLELDAGSKELTAVTSQGSFYRRALEFYFEANQARLLDPDSRTQTYDGLKQKYAAGQILFSADPEIAEAYRGGTEDVADGYAVLPAAEFRLVRRADSPTGAERCFAVLATAKNREAACRFVNWLYQPQTISLLYSGPEGVTWTQEADGPALTQAGKELFLRDGSGVYRRAEFDSPFGMLGLTGASAGQDGFAYSFRAWPSTQALERTVSETQRTASETQRRGGKSAAAWLEERGMLVQGSPAVHMLPDVPEDISAKEAEINALVKERSWALIYAADRAAFEAGWAELQTEAEALGMPEVLAWYSQAWQSAQARCQELLPGD